MRGGGSIVGRAGRDGVLGSRAVCAIEAGPRRQASMGGAVGAAMGGEQDGANLLGNRRRRSGGAVSVGCAGAPQIGSLQPTLLGSDARLNSPRFRGLVLSMPVGGWVLTGGNQMRPVCPS